jgi:alkyl hydroperoxide reductase subunit D
MTRLAKPATNKLDLELFCLAVSAINGCETCLSAHARTLTQVGLTEEHVHEAIRIAATINALALALDLGGLGTSEIAPSAAAE